MEERTSSRWFDRSILGWLVPLVFVAAGAAFLGDLGITMDEPETIAASENAVTAVRLGFTGDPFARSPHELPGFYFPFDLLRGVASNLLLAVLPEAEAVTAHRLVHLALSGITLHLLWRLALSITGSTVTAGWSVLSLATSPLFLAHAVANPKDLPALFAWVAAILALTGLRRADRWRGGILPGVALAVALSSREFSILIPAIVGAWWLLDRGSRSKGTIAAWATALAVGALGAVPLWPWLWVDPLRRLLWAASKVSSFSWGPAVLYFGTIYPSTDLPWHYTAASLAAATPVIFIAAAAIGTSLLTRRETAFCPARSLALLATLWLTVPLAVEMLAPSHYDGVRHVLVVLPALALLAGSGFAWGEETIARSLSRARLARRARAAATVVVLLCFGVVGSGLMAVHPYYGSFLNGAVNLWLPGPAEDWFEVEYWGAPYKEGALWLNAHAEEDARVLLVWTAQANFYLKRPGIPLQESDFRDTSVPQYLMLIPRKAFYNEWVEQIEREYTLVHRVTRQKATLLKIYKNVPAG